MASIILSAAGTSAGNSLGLPFGGMIGGRVGRMLGGFIDDRLFGGATRLKDVEGPRLADLAVQTSTYGRMIPVMYGNARIAGNIIWSRPISETVITTTSSSGGGGGKGGGGKVTQTSTSYSYSVSLAVAICEGAVDEVQRVWADAKQLDLSQVTIRIYKGDEEQLPDSLIQGFEGAENTPAYRGMAYVVFEDFPLADYGNRIPNFTFEVKKRLQTPDYAEQTLEEMMKSIILIPGAGEFVYDTDTGYKVPGVEAGAGFAQQGNRVLLNMHNANGIANVNLALDQLAATCPNLDYVGVVVSWFGDSLDAGECVIRPGVEYQAGGSTAPHTWGVAGYTRDTARLITQIDGSPRYGGTPDDGSILRLLTALQGRGYSIMFYPMLFLDVDGKPWRGDITGDAAGIAEFFTGSGGYNDFIMHYANLVEGYVDAFVIGSELKGLTKVTDTPGSYPAVDELVDLAADVKAVLGGGVKVTYAADWSEYHHTDGGWYHMDPLWASPDIDMIGIDAYFPLTDAPQDGYEIQPLIDGWTSGEGYDWYYSDPERTVQAPLGAAYAWKNLEWFWSHTHTNPDASVTDWVPNSKKIWFTEYGYPSVDGAANQPNVFYDPSSDSSAYPYFSRGRIDFRAQRSAHVATLAKWEDSPMVERLFAWTWDARPYPYWPDLISVWADGPAWASGHWLQGKLGLSAVGAVVADLCARAGLAADDYYTGALGNQLEGFVLTAQQTLRKSIEQLAQAFFFDAVESDYQLKFIPRKGNAAESIGFDGLVKNGAGKNADSPLSVTRMQELELPKRVNVVYLNRIAGYQPATQYAERQTSESRQNTTLDLPLVFTDQTAKIIADVTLYASWVGRTSYKFSLPMQYAYLEPGDVVEVEDSGITHTLRITDTAFGAPGILRISAVAEETAAYDFYTPPGEGANTPGAALPVSATELEILDIPALPGDRAESGYLRFAAKPLHAGWRGAALYRSDDGGTNYNRVLDLPSAAIAGAAVEALAGGPVCVFDETHSVDVVLMGSGELASASEISVLNGANAALLGDEILQFRTATLVEPGRYTLSGLLRGRLGTEWATSTHAAGERFVLLGGLLARQEMPASMLYLSRGYKPVSVGDTVGATAAENFAWQGISLKPYAPVGVCAARDGSGNITLTWIRRSRGGVEWVDYADAPLNEASELYEVEILNGSGAVVRTFSSLTSATASYTSAQQVSDFGGNQSSVRVKIYQLSAVVGRGYAADAVV